MYAVTNVNDPLSPLLRDAFATAGSFIPLKSLRHGFLEDLFLYVEPQSVPAGQIIFESGTIDHQYIYLHSGVVLLEYENSASDTVIAGETVLPLAHHQPRRCRAIAKEDCVVLRVDSDRLDRTLSWSQTTDYLLSELAANRQNDGNLDWIRTVLGSNLFFKVPSLNAEQIIECFSFVEVKQGQEIITVGDVGDCCYFLKMGKADILKVNERGEVVTVAQILEGRCFGEDALVESKPRNASVVMASDGELMRLDQTDFQKLLNEPVVEELDEEELNQRVDDYILIDVRSDAEFRLGHLALSANVPLSVLAMKKRLLSIEQPYVLYCDSGRRSRAAAYFLGKEGYNVVALAGGLQQQDLTDRLVDEPGHMLREGRLVAPQEQ